MYGDDGEVIPVVLDNGTGTCKIGFAGDDEPIDTVSGQGISNIVGSGLRSGVQGTFVGKSAQNKRELLSIRYPMEHGIVTDWDGMEKIWQYGFDCLEVTSDQQPLLISEAPLNPMANREMMGERLYETFNVPALYVEIPAILAAYAAGRSSSLVLDVGDGLSHVLPIYEGYSPPQAVRRTDIAGRDLTHYLGRLLSEKEYSFVTPSENEIVREIKESLCYCSLDFQEEMAKAASSKQEETYTLPDGEVLNIGSERFQAAEALFQPSIIGYDDMEGIHEMVYNSIMSCGIDVRQTLFYNIVLSGGTALLPGFAERLKLELNQLIPVSRKINIVTMWNRKYYVWIGGSVLGSLSTFRGLCVNKEEYEEQGPSCLHWKRL